MEPTILFRKAVNRDTEQIWQIILQAKEQMRRLNSQQWQDGYPAIENISQDIESGYGYVLCGENEEDVIAYGAVIFEGEPAYESIVGTWINDEPYVVVHRLAVADKAKRRGMASLFMQQVEILSRRNQVYSFRVDTNFDNYYMRKMMVTLGFTYCGEIQYNRGTRIAYEKSL